MTTLRLSDAIALGRMLVTKRNGMDFCGCAIGMGTAALKGAQMTVGYVSFDHARKAWPWLENLVDAPVAFAGKIDPSGLYGGQIPFHGAISRIYFGVESGQVTLDQLIDWVREHEPVPTTVESTTAEILPTVNAYIERSL